MELCVRVCGVSNPCSIYSYTHTRTWTQGLLAIHDTYAGIVARHLDNSPLFAKALKVCTFGEGHACM